MRSRSLFLLLTVFALLSSCTMEKRHYRNGFYVDWNRTEQRSVVAEEAHDTLNAASMAAQPVDEVRTEAAQLTTLDSLHRSTEKTHAHIFRDTVSALQKEDQPERPAERADEPQPEGHDRLNPELATMIISGIIFSLLFLLFDLGAVTVGATFFFVLAPLIGVLLFAGAMLLRKKIEQRKAAGETGNALRLSAHFHRFRLLLLLFFISSLAMCIGWWGPGIVGLLLGISGVVLVQGIAIVLLVLALFYIFRWRKDPTGYRKKRDPHPRKDS